MQNKNNKEKTKNPKKTFTILLLIIGVIIVVLLAIIIMGLVSNPESTYTAKQISNNQSSSPSTSSILDLSSVPSVSDDISTISDSNASSVADTSSKATPSNKNKITSKSNNQIQHNNSTIIAPQPDNGLDQSQEITSTPPVTLSSEPDTIIQPNSSEPDIITQPSSSAPPNVIQKININTATAEELDQGLPLEYLMCKAIVDYRNQNGPFKSVDDLINVDGIGKNLLKKIKPYCVV